MQTHLLLIGTLTLLLIGGFSGCTEKRIPQNPLIVELIDQIDEEKIYSTVYELQNFTTRYYNTTGNSQAATWIYNTLRNISGMTVEYQGGEFRNVIATLPGQDVSSSRVFMVGAHYDSINTKDLSTAPGATDNGGGVAIVLELARVISRYTWNHTILFSFWNAEEGGAPTKGSTVYVEEATAYNFTISLYINYDSACYDPTNQFILDILYNSQSEWVADLMRQQNRLYNIGFELTYNSHLSCFSDYKAFWKQGYTAVSTHAETHGPAHTTKDTVDKISTRYAKKNGQLGLSILATLAEPQWNI